MRIKILFLIMISLFASCGEKGSPSKAKFKIFSGNLVDPQTTFPGGLLVMGRIGDGSQSFIIPYQPGLELDLKKGSWSFATIGWLGANPMEGNQQCSFQRMDVNTDSFSVSFNMNHQNCLNMTGPDGSRFTHPMFYDLLGGTYNGFKKLYVKTCTDINACSGQTAPVSYRVEIPTKLFGVTPNLGLAPGLGSVCVSSYMSNITPPHGGSGGFIGLKITTFSSAACTGVPKTYFFNHGFGEVLNQTYSENGVSVTRKGALSVDANSPDSLIALTNVNFLGSYTDSTTTPTLSSVGANDLYVYNNGTNLTVSPNSFNSQYLYYDGTSWVSFNQFDAVKLLLQD